MNGGESGSEKKETLRLELHSIWSLSTIPVQRNAYKLDIDNHKTISNQKIRITFWTSFKILMNLNENF